MSGKKPPPDDLLAAAAELRAAGLAWEAVAARVGRAADTVRKWPALYPDRWTRAARAAEDQLLAEATAESVHTLRRQLRSEDEKASRDAADKLIRFRVAARRKKSPRKKPTGPQPSAAAVRTAAYIEGLTDDQLDALLDYLWEQRRRDLAAGPGGGRPARAGGPAGPG